jgi:hypothetical protein
MASTASNVYAAMPSVTGALRRAPLGTAAPTDATTVLPVAWVDLGYIGEDGFTESNQRDTTKKKAFGGSVVKILQTDYSSSVKFKFLESTNAEVLKAIFGEDNVTVTAATPTSGTLVTVKKNKKVLPHSSWCIDTVDGDAVRRNYIPDGQIVSVGDVKVVHTDVIEYDVEVEAFENAQGDNIIEFIDNGIFAP